MMNKLQHSDMRINEIADALGFTGESHLNKFFRKQKGQSPGQYRKTFNDRYADIISITASVNLLWFL